VTNRTECRSSLCRSTLSLHNLLYASSSKHNFRGYNRCANLVWELIYDVFYPPGLAETLAFVPWVFIDLVIVYTTIQFGPREWIQAPLVANNLPGIITMGSILMLASSWTFLRLFNDPNVACFWTGYTSQVVLSWSSLAQLLSQESTRGHSLRIS